MRIQQFQLLLDLILVYSRECILSKQKAMGFHIPRVALTLELEERFACSEPCPYKRGVMSGCPCSFLSSSRRSWEIPWHFSPLPQTVPAALGCRQLCGRCSTEVMSSLLPTLNWTPSFQYWLTWRTARRKARAVAESILEEERKWQHWGPSWVVREIPLWGGAWGLIGGLLTWFCLCTTLDSRRNSKGS